MKTYYIINKNGMACDIFTNYNDAFSRYVELNENEKLFPYPANLYEIVEKKG